MSSPVDQADGLRRLLTAGRPRIVAVAGLCAGVGATTAVMNLAAALAQAGKRVLVLDEQVPGPASLCTAWGVTPSGTLADVVVRGMPLAAAAAQPMAGVHVLPAQAAVTAAAFGARSLCRDGVIIIDVALDAQGQLSPLARLADEVAVVMLPTVASMTATYAGLKRLQFAHALQTFRFIVNRASSLREAQLVIGNVVQTSSRFLAVSLSALGWIDLDDRVREAARLHQPVCAACPGSQAAAQFRQVAAALLQPPAGGERAGPAGAPDARPRAATIAAA